MLSPLSGICVVAKDHSDYYKPIQGITEKYSRGYEDFYDLGKAKRGKYKQIVKHEVMKAYRKTKDQ